MSASASEAPIAEPERGPRRRSPWRRVVIILTMVVVVALVAATALLVVTLRKPMPQTDGEIQITGLEAEVSVIRDDQGAPQIFADTAADLMQAQGYIDAQERFFQMDVRRHTASGRLAELVGDDSKAIASDRVIRTLGWRMVAEAEYKQLDPQVKEYLQAYAEGVNAYLHAHDDPATIAVEYTILAQHVKVAMPEDWDPVDSLAWLKAVAWDLRSNYDDELARAEIYGGFSSVPANERMSMVDELFPPYPEQNAPILQADQNQAIPVESASEPETSESTDVLGDAAVQGALASANAAVSAVPHLLGEGEGIGSNSWVVSGAHTITGAPLLANDPHLSLSAPGVWSQVGLHCVTVSTECPFDVAGFSFAGFPGVLIGHNGQVAWGLTNMGADVTDFFVERVRGEGYEPDSSVPGDQGFVPLTTRTETIRVNGGEDITVQVRSTKHGPIISEVLGVDAVTNSPAGEELGEHQVSLAWTGLEPGRTAEAVFALDRAQNVDDIRAAAAIFDVPAQNIVFATTDGHIGYQAPGRVPVRQVVTGGPVVSDGSWPRPGYDPRYDWAPDYVDPAQMPFTLDPEDGIIVAANQAVLPAESGPFLTTDWDYGYRAQRIRDLLTDEVSAGRPITGGTMAAIQNDTYSPYAAVLVPLLLRQEIADPFDADGQLLLADWDYRMDADSAAAAYFAAVWRNLLEYTFWDELPVEAWPDGGSQWLTVISRMLTEPNNSYWDDKSTFGIVESSDEILTRSLEFARRDLTVDLAKDPADWSWGAMHQLRLQSALSGAAPSLLDGAIPSLLEDYLSPDAVGVGGGSSIVNATSWDAASGSFDVTSGPSMRMVVDLADLDKSTWVNVAGVSGHPESSHYDDQLNSWVAGETYPWPFTSAAVRAAGKETLTLHP